MSTVTDAPAAETILPFGEAVPGAVQEVAKDGLIVAPDKLLALAQHLRDHEGYDYLSMVTSVDWPAHFEVVYFLYGVAQPRDPARQTTTGRDLPRRLATSA